MDIDFVAFDVYNPGSLIIGNCVVIQVDMKVYKLKNLVKDLKRRIGRLLGEPKYDAKKFFKERHKRYGCDLRSVGNCTLSSEENERVYGEAREVFLGLCAKEGVDFENGRVIDIGCRT